MPPAMKRLLADLQLPANRFDRRALVEVHLRLAQLRNDLLRRVSLPFHRVLPPSRAVRLSYQLVHLEGVRSMSGDSIYMDYYSRLGPIDPQVETRQGKNVPALGYLERYNAL